MRRISAMRCQGSNPFIYIGFQPFRCPGNRLDRKSGRKGEDKQAYQLNQLSYTSPALLQIFQLHIRDATFFMPLIYLFIFTNCLKSCRKPQTVCNDGCTHMGIVFWCLDTKLCQQAAFIICARSYLRIMRLKAPY